jgi:hypothetical protein
MLTHVPSETLILRPNLALRTAEDAAELRRLHALRLQRIRPTAGHAPALAAAESQ